MRFLIHAGIKVNPWDVNNMLIKGPRSQCVDKNQHRKSQCGKYPLQIGLYAYRLTANKQLFRQWFDPSKNSLFVNEWSAMSLKHLQVTGWKKNLTKVGQVYTYHLIHYTSWPKTVIFRYHFCFHYGHIVKGICRRFYFIFMVCLVRAFT